MNISKEVPDPGKTLCVDRRGDRVGCRVENKKTTDLTLEVPDIEKFINTSEEVLGDDNILAILLFGSQFMKTNDEWSDYEVTELLENRIVILRPELGNGVI